MGQQKRTLNTKRLLQLQDIRNVNTRSPHPICFSLPNPLFTKREFIAVNPARGVRMIDKRYRPGRVSQTPPVPDPPNVIAPGRKCSVALLWLPTLKLIKYFQKTYNGKKNARGFSRCEGYSYFQFLNFLMKFQQLLQNFPP